MSPGVRRLLDCGPEDFARMSGRGLVEAIRKAEGRTLLCEVLWPAPPLADGVSNAEVVVAFGADLVLLNQWDGDDAAAIGRRLGRPVGVNVEPAEDLPPHRRADEANLRRLAGVDFVAVTANPDVEVALDALVEAAERVRSTLPEAAVLAGRMHGSGGRGLPEEKEVAALAGVADAVLVPAPGTVPGSTEARVAEAMEAIHDRGGLAVAAVGTSQEGADRHTVREIALAAKRCGADVLHLGDAGLSGVADPLNVLTASLAIRGRRHTYRRMAMR